jgi:aminopeptidase C
MTEHNKEFAEALLRTELSKSIRRNELLKAQLRNIAEQLRSGISKVQQKTLTRAIEENLKEFE